MSRKNIVGERYGKLVVIEFSHLDQNDKARWRCKCDCGNEIFPATGYLTIGDTTSCGCSRKKFKTPFRRKTMTAWWDMIDRCENPDNEYYHAYGGRGIKVCDRWQTFDGFYEDMGEPSSKELSLDRIDNARGYEPGNCRWADDVTQSRNTRRARMIAYRGETRRMTEWGEILGIKPVSIYARLRKGWTFEKAVETPFPTKTSRYRGVHLKNRTWIAQIVDGDRKVCLGRFHKETEAAQAYNIAATRIYGDKARLNIL
jgi:hypothetical protein